MFSSSPFWACCISLFLFVSATQAGPIRQADDYDAEIMLRSFGDDFLWDESQSRSSAAVKRRSPFPKSDASSLLKKAQTPSAPKTQTHPISKAQTPPKPKATEKESSSNPVTGTPKNNSPTNPKTGKTSTPKSAPQSGNKSAKQPVESSANKLPKSYADVARSGTTADKKKEPSTGKSSSSAVKPGKSYADAVKDGLTTDKDKKPGTGKPTSGPNTSGTKPRCKPGQKSKRGLYEGCTEYDPNNVKPLTKQDSTPDVERDNPTKWWGSAKHIYDDNKKEEKDKLVSGPPGNRKVNKDVVDRIAHPQVDAQKDYYASPGSKPYSKPPGALGVNVDPDAEGKGKHGLRLSTSMTSRKKTPAPAPPSVVHPSVDALRPGKDKKPRRGKKNSGAHTEEVNGSQRAYDGGKPFEGTTHATYEVYGPKGQKPEDMEACAPNCKPLLVAGGGTDLHQGAGPTTHQREEAEKKRLRKEDKKAASSDQSTNTGQQTNSGGKRKNPDTEDTASSSKRNKQKNDTPSDFLRWSNREKKPQSYVPQEQSSDEARSSSSDESSSSEFEMRRKRSEMAFVRRWLEEIVLENDFKFDF